MKKLAATAFFGGLLVLAGPALAAVVVPVEANRKVDSAALRAEGGRAWIEVKLSRRFLNGKEAREAPTSVAVAVPGLAVDSATGTITLVSGDRRVTCASIGDDVRPTGSCSIDARIASGDLVVSVDAR